MRLAADFTWKLTVYGADQAKIVEGGEETPVELTLAEGDNKLGFYVQAGEALPGARHDELRLDRIRLGDGETHRYQRSAARRYILFARSPLAHAV